MDEVYYLLVIESEINDENNIVLDDENNIVLDIEDIDILFEAVKHRQRCNDTEYYLIIKDLINGVVDNEICVCRHTSFDNYDGGYDIRINNKRITYTESRYFHLLIKNKVNLTLHSRKIKELQIQIEELKDTYYKKLGILYVDNYNDKGYVLK